jgi:hypothetical protein
MTRDEPSVWPWVIALVISNAILAFGISLLVGWTLGNTAQWIVLIPLAAYGAWSGSRIVQWRWDKWRAERRRWEAGR